MTISKWRWRAGWLACLVFGCLVLSQQSMAHDGEKMCGGLKDGDGEPVLQSGGNVVLLTGSKPCPDEPAATPTATAPASVTAVIYFDFNIDEPNADGQAALAELIEALSSGAPSSVSVQGHADRAGTEAYNLGLSERRADNVADALVGAGVAPDILAKKAFGETDPAVPTADGVREAANRRAVVELQF